MKDMCFTTGRNLLRKPTNIVRPSRKRFLLLLEGGSSTRFFCPSQKPTLSMCLEEKGFKRQPPFRGTRTRACVCGSELVSCLLFLFFHVFKMRNKLPARREEHEMLGRVLSDSESHRRNTPPRSVPIRAARPNPKNLARCAPVPCGEREILISIKHCVPSSDRCKVGRKL